MDIATEEIDDITKYPERFKVVRRGTRDPRYSLRMLREASEVTQVELAEKTGINQSELSKVERRDDVKLSTLRRYVEGLGGTLAVSVVIDGRTYRLEA